MSHWILQGVPEIVKCAKCGGNITSMGPKGQFGYDHMCQGCGAIIVLSYLQRPTVSGKLYPDRACAISVQVSVDEYLEEVQETTWARNPKEKGQKCFTVMNVPRELMDFLQKSYPVGQMGCELRSDW